jgi:Cu+-exporting ATPase
MKQNYNITGMTCAACAMHVQKATAKLDGMQNVSVDLLGSIMAVDYNPDQLSPDDIIHAVESAGYGAVLPRSESTKRKEAEEAEALEFGKNEAAAPRLFRLSDPAVSISRWGIWPGFPCPPFSTGPNMPCSSAASSFC